MQRSVSLSTEVFAAIWAQRQPGEESEDAILRRVLGCSDAGVTNGEEKPVTQESGGVYDTRNNVTFPEGFEIFRTYKHKEYRATARAGAWARHDNGQRFPTLNQLNASIAEGAENVWNGNWKYRTPNNSIRSINDLRQGQA